MLDPASWLHLAKEVALGKRKRVDHDCGSGGTMIVDHKTEGYGAYCWRCNDKGFAFHPPESLRDKLARMKREAAQEQEATRALRLPGPSNTDPSSWPLKARVWLYKAGLSNQQIRELVFYYHEGTRRVVMPVLNDGDLLYWQARGFDDDRPKYINPEVDRSKLVFKQGTGPVLVLTEDMLSAVRVGQLTEAWSILGTSIPDPVLGEIIRDQRPVKVWLDPDGPGRKGTSKAMKKLLAYGVNATAIKTDLDPKLYNREEIANILGIDATTAS